MRNCSTEIWPIILDSYTLLSLLFIKIIIYFYTYVITLCLLDAYVCRGFLKDLRRLSIGQVSLSLLFYLVRRFCFCCCYFSRWTETSSVKKSQLHRVNPIKTKPLGLCRSLRTGGESAIPLSSSAEICSNFAYDL